ncbi:hypothetical protein GQ42DRAFT_165541 [Ramicandelaber brevisporus]|nr:hypothetical protein GQ42DRAFT_165541 [Ramicandelaber brevisporus]
MVCVLRSDADDEADGSTCDGLGEDADDEADDGDDAETDELYMQASSAAENPGNAEDPAAVGELNIIVGCG